MGATAYTQQAERLILSHFPHTPTRGQQEACAQMARFLFNADPRSAFLLCGYAGTGKTSLVSAMIQAAPRMRVNTVLLAPTGRAAKVLSGYAHRAAYTIHKKIYMTATDAHGAVRTVRALNKHSYTLFIVDEASMIGLDTGATRRSLLDDLVDYVYDGNHCRLMLIGDPAQLPPVGQSESPALVASYLASLYGLSLFEARLTEVVRQQLFSSILHNATLIRQQIDTLGPTDEALMPLFDLAGGTDTIRLPGDELMDTLNREYAEHAPDEVVIVCRSNKRANLFNQGVRNSVLFRDGEVNAGDLLMVVKNNYFWIDEGSDINFIANGDMVEVQSVRNTQELYGFRFADATLRFVDYPDEPAHDCKLLLSTLYSESPSLTAQESEQLFSAVMEDYADLPTRAMQMRELRKNPYYNALQVKFAYSLTCHKTQGGQWRTVFLDQGYLGDSPVDRDYLRWLYTALTRATGQVYLINFEERFFPQG